VLLYRTIGFHVVVPLVRALYRAEVAGAERIPASGACVLAANHESDADPFVLGLVTPRVIRFMAKAELYETTLGAAFMRGFAAFPIERGRGDAAAVSRARELLDRGEIVGIFPQGTCKPFRRRPFHRTAAKLALAAGAPLVPVALVGTERILRPHRVRVGLPKVRVLVGRPIEVERAKPTLARARELTATLEAAIEELRRPYGEPAHVWID
jgi:1-acyl-sn-glycerol-3-phosphate acyltransferase